MRRRHLVESTDLPWLPATLRDLLTETLRYGITTFDWYAPAAPVLARVLRRTGERSVIDLCSGAGGPWSALLPRLAAEGLGVTVTFTDRFVTPEAVRRVEALDDPRIRYHRGPVDAAEVPASLDGVRTIFTGLHHFTPDGVRAVLRDATRGGAAVAAFEFTERSAASLAASVFVPLAMLVTTPLLRPLTVARIAWTYLLPAGPLLNLWDGVVSTLRSYTPDELLALAASVDAPGYRWEVGRSPAAGFGPAITWLIGWPEDIAPSRP